MTIIARMEAVMLSRLPSVCVAFVCRPVINGNSNPALAPKLIREVLPKDGVRLTQIALQERQRYLPRNAFHMTF